MKKRVSAELISIAHRILKLKNHSETLQLQQEAKNLYDQLTILRFYEENFEMLKNEIPAAVLEEMLEGKPLEVFSTPLETKEAASTHIIDSVIDDEKVIPVSEEKIVIAELTLDELDEDDALESQVEAPVEVEEAEEVAEATKEIISETKPEKKFIKPEKQKPVVAQQISFEDMLVHDYQELDFVKVDVAPETVAIDSDFTFEDLELENTKQTMESEAAPVSDFVEETFTIAEEKIVKEEKTISLNDSLNKGINIGLNDRIAFEKKLFGGHSDDFNRVLSQLNSFDTFDEAKDFIQDFVKPDYDNWEGNEEYETRFLEIIEKKFN
jgi:hypothetical protein